MKNGLFRWFDDHKVLVRVVLGLYLCACLLLLATRWLFTTQLDVWRDDITRLISESTGVNVTAEKIHGGFHKIWPTLELTNVELARPGGPVSLTLPKVQARIAWSSLWHLEPRFESLLVSRPSLAIERLDETRFDVAGWIIDTKPSEKKEEPLFALNPKTENPVLNWLLAQDRLGLIDGSFSYSDARDPEHVVRVEHADAVFEKGLLDYRAAFKGSLVMDGRTKPVDIRARLEKPFLNASVDPLFWNISLYADIRNSDIAGTLQRMGFPKILESGFGEARLWADLGEGRLKSLTGEVSITNVNARVDASLPALELAGLSGSIDYGAEDADEGARTYKFELKDLKVLTKRGKALAPSDLGLELTLSAHDEPVAGSFHAKRLNLAEISGLIPALPISEELRAGLMTSRPSGVLHHLAASFKGDPADIRNWAVDGGFEGLSLPADTASGRPGFENLSGTVKTDRSSEAFAVKLDSKRATLSFPGVFRDPDMVFGTFKADARVSLRTPVKVDILSLSASNQDAAVTASGSWTATGGAGTIDVGGKILRAKAVRVVRYLPNVVGEGVLDWVGAAIRGGRAAAGDFTVRGELSGFPWDDSKNKSDLFRIRADLKDVTLDFMPPMKGHEKPDRWPELTGIEGELDFTGDSMFVRHATAHSSGLKANGVEAAIRTLSHDSLLEVDGHVEGTVDQALGYLHKADTIRSVIGDTFSKSKGDGTVTATLGLRIPIGAKGSPAYRVATTFHEDDFSMGFGVPVVHKLKGELVVDEKGARTPAPVNGETREGPITIEVLSEAPRVKVVVNGTLSSDELFDFAEIAKTNPVRGLVEGHTPVTAITRVDMSRGVWTLEAASTMLGIDSRVPAPLGKEAMDMAPTKVGIRGEGGNLSVDIKTDERVETLLDFKRHADGGYDLVDIDIGVGTAPAPRTTLKGVCGAVRLETLEADRWLELMKSIEAASKKADGKTVGKPDLKADAKAVAKAADASGRMDLRLQTLSFDVGEVTAGGPILRGLKGSVVRTGEMDWYVDVKSNDVAGTMKARITPVTVMNRFEADVSRLHLPERTLDFLKSIDDDPDGTDKPIELKALPDLALRIKSLVVNGRDFGAVTIEGANAVKEEGRTWTTRKLEMAARGATLRGSLAWFQPVGDTEGETNAKLDYDARDTGAFLDALGVDKVVRGVPGTARAELNWTGSPVTPKIDTMNGTFEARGREGAILKVEPGAGRLLSLFSMQHLIKRLTLDFSDVLKKGFGFDSIQVDGTMRNGVMNIPKLAVFGSSATVLLGGDVDLNNEQLDMHAVVLPSINAGAPALALSIVNPAVGIGTFVTQWLLKDQLSNMFKAEYSIKGGFENPEIKNLSPHKRPSVP